MTNPNSVLAAGLSPNWRERLEPFDPSTRNPDRIVKLAYRPGEATFDSTALSIHRNGWTIIPQERSGKRLGSKIDGRALLWGAYATKDKRPTEEDVRWWMAVTPQSNIAAITEEAPDGIRIVDIDISQTELARRVIDIADRVLGETVYRRVGAFPRMILIYRGDPADPILKSRTLRLVQEKDGAATGYAIEILGPKRLVTFYGHHHKTGCYFTWGRRQPIQGRPEEAPVVSAAKIQEFLEAVDAELEGYRLTGLHADVAVSEGETEPASVSDVGIVVPGGRKSIADVNWRSGHIVDGAEIQATKRAFAYCLHNPRLLKSEEGLKALTQALYEELYRDMSPNQSYRGGNAFPNSRELMKGCRARIRSGAKAVLRKGYMFKAALHDENGLSLGVKSAVRIGQASSDNNLRFLPDPSMRRRVRYISRTYCDPVARARRALKADRRKEAARVAAAVRNGADAFLMEAFTKARDTPVWILQAPTGAGKTSTLIERISHFYRQHPDFDKAIFLFMPSYSNIEEAVEKAVKGRDGNTPLFNKLAEDVAKEARDAGVEVMVYTGKEKGGCTEIKKLRLLQAAKIGTSGLCKSTVSIGEGEIDTKFCDHYKNCPVIKMRKAANGRKLVILPLAFITLDLPAEVKEAAGAAIFDERVWSELVRSTVFPASALKQARREPRPTKEERESGITGDDFLAERVSAVEVVEQARRDNACPALVLHRYRRRVVVAGKARVIRGKDLVDSCLVVTGRTRDAAKLIRPDMDEEEIRAIAERPQGKFLHDEWRFWKIIRERMEQIEADELQLSLVQAAAKNTGKPIPAVLSPEERRARGLRDMRIQWLDGDTTRDTIRISWRVQPNFSSLPTLLLDASADPEIIAKCWAPRPVRLVSIEASLHVRVVACLDSTYSAGSILPERATNADNALNAGMRAHKIRRMVSNASQWFGKGRVIAGAMMKVRERLQGKALINGAMVGTWAEPDNVDFGHYGAFRGLDYAKMHMCAIAIGRLDLPARVIDGLVAAITYDDVEPELPIDIDGTGVRPGGRPLTAPETKRAYPLRDGSDFIVTVPQWPGRWAAKVQRQYREEELKQFLGRLRPVYRDGEAPVLFALGRVLPGMDVVEYKDGNKTKYRADQSQEGGAWIIDEIVSLDDIASPKGYDVMGEVIRRVGVSDAALAGEEVYDLLDPVSLAALAKSAGLDGDDLSGPHSQGMMAVKADLGGVAEQMFQIPAYVADPEAHIRKLVPKGTPVEVTVVAEPMDRVPSQTKKPDKIDEALGTKAQRRQREAAVRAEAAGRVYAEVMTRQGGGLGASVYAAPSGPLKDRLVPLEVRIILEQAAPEFLSAPIVALDHPTEPDPQVTVPGTGDP